MADAQLGRSVRQLLKVPNVIRVEVYGKPGRKRLDAMKRDQLAKPTLVPEKRTEQIRAES